MPDRSNPFSHSEQDLDLPDPDHDSAAILDSQVQKAQEQLVSLRRQADQIEKQKRELEDLSQRQEEVERGRSEMVQKFARSLAVLERESGEAEKRVEQLRNTHLIFSEHLDILEAINPRAWASTELSRELAKAQSDVEDARSVFAKNVTRIESQVADLPGSPSSGYGDELSGHGFLYWLQAGFAFTLPIFVLGITALIIYLLHAK